MDGPLYLATLAGAAISNRPHQSSGKEFENAYWAKLAESEFPVTRVIGIGGRGNYIISHLHLWITLGHPELQQPLGQRAGIKANNGLDATRRLARRWRWEFDGGVAG